MTKQYQISLIKINFIVMLTTSALFFKYVHTKCFFYTMVQSISRQELSELQICLKFERIVSHHRVSRINNRLIIQEGSGDIRCI